MSSKERTARADCEMPLTSALLYDSLLEPGPPSPGC